MYAYVNVQFNDNSVIMESHSNIIESGLCETLISVIIERHSN